MGERGWTGGVDNDFDLHGPLCENGRKFGGGDEDRSGGR